MSVKELIEALKQFDENARVTIYDAEWGYVDITEIFESEVKDNFGKYKFVRIA